MLLTFGRWILDIDPRATRAASADVAIAGPEECGCLECRNFATARRLVYPKAALELFEQLGLEPLREAAVLHTAVLPSGLHLYGGWVHVIGEIRGGLDAKQPAASPARFFHLERINDWFSMGFTSDSQLVHKAFARRPLIQLEFLAEVPWVLPEPYDD